MNIINHKWLTNYLTNRKPISEYVSYDNKSTSLLTVLCGVHYFSQSFYKASQIPRKFFLFKLRANPKSYIHFGVEFHKIGN